MQALELDSGAESEGDLVQGTPSPPVKRRLDMEAVCDEALKLQILDARLKKTYHNTQQPLPEVPPNPAPKASDAVDAVPSQFHASGLPAVDISRVQKAALDSLALDVLTPQQQLELLKADREKRGKMKGGRSNKRLGGMAEAAFCAGWLIQRVGYSRLFNSGSVRLTRASLSSSPAGCRSSGCERRDSGRH